MPHFGRFDMSPAAAGAAQSITVGASPFNYTGVGDGLLVVSGGSVSLITYSRNGSAIALGLISGTIPILKGDVVAVTWLVSAPTMTFIPSRAA